MHSIVLTIDGDQLPEDVVSSLSREPDEDENCSVADLQELLQAASPNAVELETPTRHPEWEEGEPCPECGNDTLSVMAADEGLYRSRNGEFSYLQNDTAVGTKTSILCPKCMTTLFDTPVEQLWR